MTDSTALFGGDKFSMFSDIGMAGAALYFLLNQMLFMGEIKAEDLRIDFFNPAVAVRTLSRDFSGHTQETFGFIRRTYDT
jgi:hypothetical protein